MKIEVNKNGNVLTINPFGRLDTSTSPELQLDYLSSAGLRVLMSTQKIMNKQGEMRLINVNEDVMDIFDMTGLTDVFDIE